MFCHLTCWYLLLFRRLSFRKGAKRQRDRESRMSSLKQMFLSLDLYKYKRFFDEDGYSHSWHSYTFTFVAIFTIVYLVTGEIVGHFKPEITSDLFINDDIEGSSSFMAVDFDVTFEEIPCFYIDITVSDVTGALTHNISKNIQRIRLDHKGRALGLQDEGQLVDHEEHHKEVNTKELSEYERILSDNDFVADGHVEELSGQEGLTNFIKSRTKNLELVFIDFYAPWCIWCQRLEPILAKLGQELGKKGPIYVGRIDCTKSENQRPCQAQHVHSFPTMNFYRHGDEVPFEAYHGERTVEAMKKRAVEIARGDEQNAADKRKIELHRLDGETGPPVGKESCQIKGTTVVNLIPSQLRFHLTSPRHSIAPEKINATHTVTDLHFSYDMNHLHDTVKRVVGRRASSRLANTFSRALSPDFLQNKFLSHHQNQTFTHYVRVIPTSLAASSNSLDFAFTHYGNEHVDDEDVASVVLDLDISTVGIRQAATYQPFYALVTRLLAVLGGAFSVINVLRGFTAEMVKITMGKQD